MVTTAVLNRRRYDHSNDVTQRLQRALDSRILMEQAKGRVSVQVGTNMRTAQQLIHGLARALDRPVGEVVRDVAAGRLTMPRDGAAGLRQSTGS